MSDSVAALTIALNKLVETLHETGVIDAAALSKKVEGITASGDIDASLADIADDMRQIADRCVTPRQPTDPASKYPPTAWQQIFVLIVQYLIIKESSFDRHDFAEYLDLCVIGLENHDAPQHLLPPIRDLADYSRGMGASSQFVRDCIAGRYPKKPLSDKP